MATRSAAEIDSLLNEMSAGNDRLNETTSQCHWRAVDSSSSSKNEYYLGGIIALLLQDHRTMSTKSVCSSQYMVTDKHRATGTQIKHSTLRHGTSARIREWQSEQNSLQFSAEDGKRRRVLNVLR